MFLPIVVIYYITSAGATPFDYFSRLADSFIKGIYWLQEQPAWLTELIPSGPDKFFVVYPPMPAILLIIPRLLFGTLFEQQFLAHLLGFGIAIIMVNITLKITDFNKLKAIWIGLFVGLGTIIWFLSSVGSSWYIGQISAAFFISLAILEGIGKKRPIILGILLGCAYLSRIHTILCIVFFMYILYDKNWFKSYFKLGLSIAPFILFNFWYNFIRFGTIFDTAYFILPSILNETNSPWFAQGVANVVYIPNNIKAMFWTFPKIINEFPYIIPSWAGLSIWITSPAFIYAFFADIKDRLVRYSWISILLIMFVVFTHGGTGWAQFGYRFAVDFYPFLIFLVIMSIKDRNLKWHHWFLLSLSIIVNFWGVLFINKFGWVTF